MAKKTPAFVSGSDDFSRCALYLLWRRGGFGGLFGPITGAHIPGEEDQEILAWYRRMIRLRWEYPVLCQGDFRSFHQGEDIYGFQRKNARERLVVFVNRSLKENKEADR